MAKPWEKYQTTSSAKPWEKYANTESEFNPDEVQPTTMAPGQLESGVRGLAQGASLGFADELTGAIESMLSDKTYEQARDEARAAYEAAQQANPKTYGAGQIGGAVASSFIPGLNIAKGAGLAATAGKAALQGGLMGLGSSEADLTKGEFGQAAADTAKSAALGGALGAAGYGVGKGLEKLAASRAASKAAEAGSSKLDEIAEKQAAKALGAGTKEFKDVEAARQLGRQALDEGVITPLSSTEKMLQRAEDLKAAGASKMNQVYGTIDEAGASTFNPLETAVNVENKLNPTYRTPINKGEWGQLENTLESILARGDKNISMAEAQGLKEEIGAVAFPRGRMPIDPTPKQQMAIDAYHVVKSAIDDAAQAGSDKLGIEGLKDMLQQGKTQYGAATKMESLLTNKLAREEAGNVTNKIVDKLLSPLDYGSLGTTYIARKGLEKVTEKLASPQMKAMAANNLAELVRTSPQMFGRFANVLQQAAARSPQALAATSFVLEQTNPEYMQIKRKVQGLEGE